MLLSEIFNPQVFTRGFEKERNHGRYRLVARVGRMPYSPDRRAMRSDQFRVEAWRGRSLVGWVNFEIIDDHLEALDVVVEPQHRRKGIASAMYQFARDLGNDIQPSSKQTALGRKFHPAKPPEQEEKLDELSFLGSQCTKDCSGHRAGYAWYKQNGRDPLSWSPSFNKGAALAKAGK